MVDMINGGFAYGYLFIAQHKNIKNVLTKLIQDIKPSQILEIGTFHGGLTLMLSDILIEHNMTSTKIRTYDVENQEFLKPLCVDRNIEVFTTNIFTDDYTQFRNNESLESIKNFINQDGTTIVMCDGGCKKCEVNIISNLLKDGDIIMAHDYAPNEIFFNENMKDKIWNWHEIQDSDINNISLECNLKPYHQELLQSVAWMCRRKV